MSNYVELAPYSTCPFCQASFIAESDDFWKQMIEYRCPDGHYLHKVSSFGEIVSIGEKDFFIVYPIEVQRIEEVADYVTQQIRNGVDSNGTD